jgi:type II secretory pathway pseudopilin PulG
MLKKRGLFGKEEKISKKSQIWVETVLYTLIGFSILAILLSIALPKIGQMKDRVIVEQTIDVLNSVNSKIIEASAFPGNSRQIILGVRKGEYVIDSVDNKFYFILKDSRLLYSELNLDITSGNIIISTKENNKNYDISLSLDYSLFNVTYEDSEIRKVLTKAPNPYVLLVENKGGADKNLNFKLIGA